MDENVVQDGTVATDSMKVSRSTLHYSSRLLATATIILGRIQDSVKGGSRGGS